MVRVIVFEIETRWIGVDIKLADFYMHYVFEPLVVICFWAIKQATPGMMAVSAKLVDADTGLAPSTGQCIGRYFAGFLAVLPLGLGIVWIAFDKRKQGWHDKLARTVVIRPQVKKKPVRFLSG